MLFKLSFPRIRRPTPYASFGDTNFSVNFTAPEIVSPAADTFRQVKDFVGYQ